MSDAPLASIPLSIVTTLYQSAPHLESFYARMAAAADRFTPHWELIFVNDGSPDDSKERVLAFCRNDRRISLVDLSRNFGHHCAMMTGLSYARGELVFLIDSDLEEDPEWLTAFEQRRQSSQADLVFGIQNARKGKFMERVTGALFYRAFNRLSTVHLVPNPTTACLMTRRFLLALLQHRECDPFLAGLRTITGFLQEPVVVSKHSRGSTSYSWRKRMALGIQALTSFSELPLTLMFYAGLAVFLAAAFGAVFLIYRKIMYGIDILGWASLIVSIWMMAGIIMLFLGILGIYLGRIFLQVKGRPYAIIRDVHRPQP